jgi:hypothetical protein
LHAEEFERGEDFMGEVREEAESAHRAVRNFTVDKGDRASLLMHFLDEVVPQIAFDEEKKGGREVADYSAHDARKI